jgi:hypothetical protein
MVVGFPFCAANYIVQVIFLTFEGSLRPAKLLNQGKAAEIKHGWQRMVLELGIVS